MIEKKEEIINQSAQVAPSPDKSAIANTTIEKKAEIENKPEVNHSEENNKKQIAAFIKMRQENRELKRKLEQVKSASIAPQQNIENKEEDGKSYENVSAQPKQKSEPTQPEVNSEKDIEEEGHQAIEELANDKQVSSVPGAIIDIVGMVDHDPRLSRLYKIDPTIAIREAKNIWASKLGISNSTPSIPKDSTPSGGIGVKTDLVALFNQLDKETPGSAKYSDLVKKINELNK